ncbi:unnamed protein product, partial [Meganyctiphanes norvegica]
RFELHEVRMDSAHKAFFDTIPINGIKLEAERQFQHYQKYGNTEDMFKYIYNMEESDKYLNMGNNNDGKDDLISTKLREEGNNLYKRKELKGALEKYNKCILSAKHPKFACENIDMNEYTPLSMGYGNRSALLFQLKEYEKCISDIDRSINLCYLEITQFKLKERKVKCLIAIERYKEAQDLLKNCEVLLNTLKLEEKGKDAYKKSLSKLLQQCVRGINSGKCQNKKQLTRFEEIKNADTSASFCSDDLIFAYNNPTPPNLDDEPNPNIPAFSRALKL